ncbi:YccT family protein [Agarivorans sp.]|uniref:YccT family protein n=1 Tax=Agarivorans sp. TaxID=1872412 RepID=UPI003CFD540D
MRFFGKTLFLTFACLSSLQAFASSFSTPVFYEIMYLDKQSTGMLSLNKNQTELTAGEHQVVVRYTDTLGSNSSSEIIKSEPIVINLNVKNGQDIVLEAKKPRSARQARRYAEDPQFTLVDKKGTSVEASFYLLPFQPGMQLSRNYLNEIAELEAQQAEKAPAVQQQASAAVPAATKPKNKPNKANNTAAIAASTVAVASTASAVSPAAETVVINADDNTELQMLQFWYQRADKATRKQFQIWTIQQQ